LAEDDGGRAVNEEVLACEQPLLDGGGHAALEEHGLAGAADGAEEPEARHVARADLDEVGDLGDGGHVRGRPRPGDAAEGGAGGRAPHPDERPRAVALERVRRGPWLERAPAEEARAGGGDPLGGGEDLPLRLDAARAGEEDGRRAGAEGRAGGGEG